MTVFFISTILKIMFFEAFCSTSVSLLKMVFSYQFDKFTYCFNLLKYMSFKCWWLLQQIMTGRMFSFCWSWLDLLTCVRQRGLGCGLHHVDCRMAALVSSCCHKNDIKLLNCYSDSQKKQDFCKSLISASWQMSFLL